MSSTAAQDKNGGRKDYRASEGRVVKVPYRGAVAPVIQDILGGVRSTCTYVGAKSLKELSKRTTFIQVNNGKQYNSNFENRTVGE
jgi:GMP reductase